MFVVKSYKPIKNNKAMKATEKRVDILKGDLIRFKVNEREITWPVENFLSETNGLLVFDLFGTKSIKPGEYQVIRNGNVVNQ